MKNKKLFSFLLDSLGNIYSFQQMYWPICLSQQSELFHVQSVAANVTSKGTTLYSVTEGKYQLSLTEGHQVGFLKKGTKFSLQHYRQSLAAALGVCATLLKLHYWFKSYGNFAERVDFGHWWSCFKKVLRAACEAGLFLKKST